jgi:hypothetical protein
MRFITERTPGVIIVGAGVVLLLGGCVTREKAYMEVKSEKYFSTWINEEYDELEESWLVQTYHPVKFESIQKDVESFYRNSELSRLKELDVSQNQGEECTHERFKTHRDRCM